MLLAQSMAQGSMHVNSLYYYHAIFKILEVIFAYVLFHTAKQLQ